MEEATLDWLIRSWLWPVPKTPGVSTRASRAGLADLMGNRSRRPKEGGGAAVASVVTDDARQALENQVRTLCEARHYEGAVTHLLHALGPKVMGFLVQRLRSLPDAAEVFSIFSEDLWRGLPGFEWRCTVRGWCFALARNAANRFAAAPHARRERNVPLSESNVRDVVWEVRERTLAYLRTRSKSKLQELRDELPEDERALLALRVDQEMEWREIAVVLDFDGCTPEDSDLARAAARLRKRFQLVKERLRRRAAETGLLPEP